MNDLIFSPTSPAAGLGPVRLEFIHADITLHEALYDGWRIVQVDHYKEKTAVGHEFHVLRVRRGTEEILIRLERRPGTQAVSGHGASSSEVVTEDTICRLDVHEFRPSDYYHISTTICEEHPAFTLLDMCILCAFLMRVAPTYSVTRATHCFWFCSAFLIQVRRRGYSLQPIQNRADYVKRGRFSGFKTLTEEYVEKTLDDRAPGAARPKSVLHHIVQKGSYLFFRTNARAWRPAKWELEGHTALVTSVCFTPTGQYILSGSSDKSIRLWNAARGSPVHRFPGGHSGHVYSLAVSRDELIFASSSSDQTVRIWNLNARLPIGEPLKRHTGSVSSVALSPDGSKILSGSFDGSMLIWDLPTAAVVGQLPHAHEADGAAGADRQSRATSTEVVEQEADGTDETDGIDRENGSNQNVPGVRVMSVAWSSDGRRIVSGYSDGTIRLWDALSGQPLHAPLRGHEDSVTAVAFSPDGLRIASGSKDKTVRLWGTASGRELLDAPFRGHAGLVHCIAFSPDGKWLASGSSDRTVRVWDCYADARGERADVLEAGSPVWSVAWSPRDQIAAGCQDCKIRTWTRA